MSSSTGTDFFQRLGLGAKEERQRLHKERLQRQEQHLSRGQGDQEQLRRREEVKEVRRGETISPLPSFHGLCTAADYQGRLHVQTGTGAWLGL